MSAQVAEYRGLCEALAARIVRPGRMSRTGVEYDDLVQEGLINVWEALSKGVVPDSKYVRGAMLDYIKKMGRQKLGGNEEFVPYDEEFHDVEGVYQGVRFVKEPAPNSVFDPYEEDEDGERERG